MGGSFRVEWGGSYIGGVGWSCRGRVDHTGVEWGGSCRGWVGM